MHEAPLVRRRIALEKVAVTTEQEHIAGTLVSARQTLEYLLTEKVHQHDTPFAAGAVVHGGGDAQHGLQRLLDLTLFDVQVQG